MKQAHFKFIAYLLATLSYSYTYGQQWSMINNSQLGGISGGQIVEHNGKLFLLKTNNLYKSNLTANTWEVIPHNLSYNSSDLSQSMVSSGTQLFLQKGNSLYKSSDEGVQWTETGVEILNPVLLTAIDDTVFVLGRDEANTSDLNYYIYFNVDGSNWIKGANIGTKYVNFISANTFPLVFSAYDSNILYSSNGISSQLYNTGKYFNGTQIRRAGNYLFIFESSMDSNDELYYDMFKMNLSDKQWHEITFSNDTIIRPAQQIGDLLFLTLRNNSVYKVIRTFDFGVTWENIFQGSEAELESLFNPILNPSNSPLISTNNSATLVGVWRGFPTISTDSGVSWTQQSENIFGKNTMYSSGSTLYSLNEIGHLNQSTNNGADWSTIDSGQIGFYDFQGEAYYFKDNQIIYKINDVDQTVTEITAPFIINFSNDDIWYTTIVNVVRNNSNLFVEIKRDTWYDNYSCSYYTYRSSDGGNTWTDITNNLPIVNDFPTYTMHFVSDDLNLYGIQHHAGNNGHGYLRISSNNGNTWNTYDFDTLLPTGYYPAYLIETNHKIYLTATNNFAGDLDINIYRVNSNGTITWINDTQLPAFVTYPNLIYTGSKLYLGYEGEFYSSEDQGQTWKMESKQGMYPGLIVNSLVEQNGDLFLGTNIGAWKRSGLIITSTKIQHLNNLQVFPNPSNGNVYFTSTKKGKYQLYSIDGKMIQSGLILENMSEQVFLESGFYILQTESEGVIEQEKIIIY